MTFNLANVSNYNLNSNFQLPFVNVNDFGARGDGATDDTAAIQAAVNSLSARGGTVVLPAASYAIKTGPVNVSTDSITLLGTNRQGATLLTAAGADVAILNLNGFRTVARGMRVAGSNSLTTIKDTVTITANAVECLLEDMMIQNGRNGVRWLAGEAYMHDVKVIQTFGTGVFIRGGGYIRRCKLDDVYPYGSPPTAGSQPANTPAAWAGTTGYTAGQSLVTVGGWLLQAMTSGTSGGSSPTVLTYNQTITDGTVTWQLVGPADTAMGAIQIDTGSAALIVTETDMTTTRYNSVSFTNTLAGNAPQSIVFVGDTFGTSYQNGINGVTGGYGLQVDNCQFANTLAANGSAVNAYGVGNQITNNQIFSIINPIALQTGCSKSIITGNTLGNCTNAFLTAANISDFIVAHNTFGDSVQGGCINAVNISAGTSDYYSISNNNLHGAAIIDGGTGTHKTIMGNN